MAMERRVLSAVYVYTDGAAEPNPGPSASAWLIVDPVGWEVLAEGAEYLGRGTNNEAEYTAIIKGLDECAAHCRGVVRVFSDSQLCINQINGSWRVREPRLRPLLAEVSRRRAFFKEVRFQWVSRENQWVSICDRNAMESIAGHREGPSP